MNNNFFKTVAFFFFWIILLAGCSMDAGEVSNNSGNAGGKRSHSDKSWTIVIYMAADNDLESSAIADFNELEEAEIPDNVNVLVLFDRAEGYDSSNGNWTGTRLYKIRREKQPDRNHISSQRLNCPELDLTVNEDKELDMNNKDVLSLLLNYMQEEFPGDYYGLIMWGHGNGWRSDDAELNKSENGVRAFATDLSSSGRMELTSLGKALREGMKGQKLDFIGFDTCFGTTLEVAVELSDCAAIMAGTSAIVPEAGWNYTSLFKYFGETEMTPADLGKSALNQYKELYSLYSYGCFSVLNLENINSLVNDASGFFEWLAVNINDNEKKNETSRIFEKKALSYMGLKYPTDFYVDLEDLVSLIIEAKPDGLCHRKEDFFDSEIWNSVFIDSWSFKTGNCSAGLYYATYKEKGIFNISHPDLYVFGSRNPEQCRFVRECPFYVPTQTCSGSVLDKLFYTFF